MDSQQQACPMTPLLRRNRRSLQLQRVSRQSSARDVPNVQVAVHDSSGERIEV